MSAYEDIRYEVKDGAAWLALNRPDRLNALSAGMMAEIRDVLDRLTNDGARVLVIQGEGRAFCSGAALNAVDPAEAPDLGDVLEQAYAPVMERLHALSIPVIASVQGAAAGAGCSLALAADFVVAARSAYFLLAFVNIGLAPDAGATWVVPRLIGQARAAEMMLLGERIPADKAADWGLIHRAVEPEVLADTVSALAARLASGPTTAYGLIRQGLRGAAAQTFSETLATEARHQSIAGRSADFREGVAAFQEKRAPRFTGG